MDGLTRAALAARDGDTEAFTELVRRSHADVWRMCAQLGSPGAADDLTQETYARVVRALPSYRAEASARTWLLSIARRACADHVRTTVRQRRLLERIAASFDRGAETTDGSEVVGLEAAIAALPHDHREVVVLTQILGLSYDEAAEVIGCPVGTVRSRLSRARERLVAALADHSDDAVRRAE